MGPALPAGVGGALAARARGARLGLGGAVGLGEDVGDRRAGHRCAEAVGHLDLGVCLPTGAVGVPLGPGRERAGFDVHRAAGDLDGRGVGPLAAQIVPGIEPQGVGAGLQPTDLEDRLAGRGVEVALAVVLLGAADVPVDAADRAVGVGGGPDLGEPLARDDRLIRSGVDDREEVGDRGGGGRGRRRGGRRGRRGRRRDERRRGGDGGQGGAGLAADVVGGVADLGVGAVGQGLDAVADRDQDGADQDGVLDEGRAALAAHSAISGSAQAVEE